MSAITIRKLPDGAKQRLRMRAAAKGRSMEAEARDILLTALDVPDKDLNWIEALMEIGYEYPGEPIPEPEYDPWTPPDFSDHPE